MEERRRRNQAVLDGHRLAGSAEVGKKPGPPQSGRCIPRQAGNSSNSLFEPAFEPPPAPALCQEVNAEADFSQDDRIYLQLALVGPQPLDDFGARSGLGRLAEDIRVNQVGHRVSVDSDSIGVKKPFAGHASNQSTKPSFGAGWWRDRRYSPRSRRSSSNSCPASIPSRCRNSAGRTICPLEDTLVIMWDVRYRLTRPVSNKAAACAACGVYRTALVATIS